MIPQLWACVGLFSACTLCVLYRSWDLYRPSAFSLEATQLQWRFLIAWYLCTLGEWLQWPLIFRLPDVHLDDSVQVNQLLAAGYLAGVLTAFVVGVFADRFSRKRACQLYCLVAIGGCILSHVRSFSCLMLSRMLFGGATCILYSCFDAWYVKRHRQAGYSETVLRDTIKYMWFGNFIVAIAAGFACDLVLRSAGTYGTNMQLLHVELQSPASLLLVAEKMIRSHTAFASGGEVAVFTVSLLILLVAFCYITAVWERDESASSRRSAMPLGRGGGGTSLCTPAASQLSLLPGAASGSFFWRRLGLAVDAVRESGELQLLGLTTACAEAALFVFVPSWDPSLTFYGSLAVVGSRGRGNGGSSSPSSTISHVTDDPERTIFRGALFATLMMGCLVGVMAFSLRYSASRSPRRSMITFGDVISDGVGSVGDHTAAAGSGALWSVQEAQASGLFEAPGAARGGGESLVHSRSSFTFTKQQAEQVDVAAVVPGEAATAAPSSRSPSTGVGETDTLMSSQVDQESAQSAGRPASAGAAAEVHDVYREDGAPTRSSTSAVLTPPGEQTPAVAAARRSSSEHLFGADNGSGAAWKRMLYRDGGSAMLLASVALGIAGVLLIADLRGKKVFPWVLGPQYGFAVFAPLFCALLLYVVALGFFFPLAACAKAFVVPEQVRATVCNLYRVPLNLAAVALLMLPEVSDEGNIAVKFVVSGGLTAVAAGGFFVLSLRTSNRRSASEDGLGRGSSHSELRGAALLEKGLLAGGSFPRRGGRHAGHEDDEDLVIATYSATEVDQSYPISPDDDGVDPEGVLAQREE